jgi:hypothetical protein
MDDPDHAMRDPGKASPTLLLSDTELAAEMTELMEIVLWLRCARQFSIVQRRLSAVQRSPAQ